MEEILFEVKYPTWFNITLTIVCIVGFFLFLTLIILSLLFSILKLHTLLVLVALLTSSLLLFYFVAFYKIFANQQGILACNIVKKTKFLYWSDIVLVRRALNYPLSLIVIFITKDNRKLYAIADMKNFEELLKTLKLKNPDAQIKMKYRRFKILPWK